VAKFKEKATLELTRIYHNNGGLKASDVLDEARSEDSPIHEYFEWDDSVAANLHRLKQARVLIRVTPVEISEGVEEKFIHVSGANAYSEGTYLPPSVIVQNGDMFNRAVSELLGKIHAMQSTVEDLRSISGFAGGTAESRVQVALRSLEVAESSLQLMLREAS